MNDTMQEVMRLMQTGDLRAATTAIQRGLNGQGSPAVPPSGGPSRGNEGAGFIDGDYRHEIDDSDPSAQRENRGNPDSAAGNIGDDVEFASHRFVCAAGAIDYMLFVPSGLDVKSAPLIVMLHGCTQSPEDFARGTRMNAVAREHGYVVAYPAQAQSRNPSKCWNWFRGSDQQRGLGEPRLLAELTRDIVKRCQLDDRRIYVAGLSAGGAMAAVLGSSYPDIFAAIGVHSGLPFGVAHDLPSAFAAMKHGGGGALRVPSPAIIDPVPAIVFHGDRDTTVDARNGAAVIAQCTGSEATSPNDLHTTVERGAVPNGRRYTRTLFRDPEGKVVAEQWAVHGAGHAWSGGDRSGTYTDPSGPDASEHMVRFFSALARASIN